MFFIKKTAPAVLLISLLIPTTLTAQQGWTEELVSPNGQEKNLQKEEQEQTRPAIANVSYYGSKRGHFEGRPTASGVRFYRTNPNIGAHLSLPFGTIVRFTNPENGRVHDVTILDRGPCHKGREFDVSEAAAIKLGFRHKGVASLQYQIIKMGDKNYPSPPCAKYRSKGQLRYG